MALGTPRGTGRGGRAGGAGRHIQQHNILSMLVQHSRHKQPGNVAKNVYVCQQWSMSYVWQA